ncbi:DUF2946 family protein [Sphaerotilus sp.]|uniref:DUF2946 family protein n=1 Tax=Sphaerotilus sp. TaxID=2093942 RepID=UPI002ACD317C|nr:DUF2946 family protein [Sphaerotilus sp.]MDZ7855637.1 hypothetical protein [Sphaerotilus sp.]
MACWLLLVAACLPTLSRLIAAADPVRAAMMVEVCSVSSRDRGEDRALPGDVMGGVHCAACVVSVLQVDVPTPDRRADFDRPVLRLRPVEEPLRAPRPRPVGPQIPPRAPPLSA